ncbi:MAG: SDR family oxidoreductase [Anaerolineales bacterium]|nr:SDR family oxidoreductase [Anaerolineales bacterium]
MNECIVITGSTRGIGHGLAGAFLARERQVVISGRSQSDVDQVVAAFTTVYSKGNVFGQACDVTAYDQVKALWEAAVAQFGKVDIWINNAGIAHPQLEFWNLSPDLMRAVVETNLVGAMFGARVALRGMLAQGFGSVYNMEGLGSGGRRVKGLASYALSKAGLRYFTDALAEEVEGTPIIVGALQPGMVSTELITKQYQGKENDWERAKRIFNILSDRVETVAPWLAERVLENRKNGARFQWLTRTKLFWRFSTAPFFKRNIFD